MSQSIQEKPVRLKDASFSVAARLAMQLGRESISNSRIAIVELIKNSYDADAVNVRITFVGLSTSSPSLIIEDDGNGMIEDDIREHWFRIGTDYKLGTEKSPRKKRPLTGEKGLGRLGLDRLCRSTHAQFFSERSEHGTEIHLDWTKYDNTHSGIETIRHECFRISKEILDPITGRLRLVKKGTRLTLNDLRDSWDMEAISELHKELTLLVSPFGNIGDFNIFLYTGKNIEGLDGKVTSEDVLTNSEWYLTADLTIDGLLSYRMRSRKYKKEYNFGPIHWHEKFKERGENPECGPLNFVMYFFTQDKKVLESTGLTYINIGTFLGRNQGIRIYRDGFRVKPYGEPNGEGDWLTLAYRRQSSPAGVRDQGWRVGYNQVVGAVFISKSMNPKLVDQTNREGIVEEKAYFDLRTFILDAIKFFQLRRVEFENQQAKKPERWEETQETARKSAEASREAAKELDEAKNRIGRIIGQARKEKKLPDSKAIEKVIHHAISTVGSSLKQVSASQEILSREAARRDEEFQQRRNTLANLASLGILTTCFGHETLASCNLVLSNAKVLSDHFHSGLLKVASKAKGEITDSLDQLIKYSQRIETFSGFVLKNTARDKRKRKKINLIRIIDNVFKFFKAGLDDKYIHVDLLMNDSIPEIHGFEIDWESIFINLITNAVWAIVEGGISTTRRIQVEVRKTQIGMSIRFADSGKGLEPGSENAIFNPGFTTKRNSKGEDIGTGMGLTIVKGFVEEYDGAEIIVESPSKIGGAEFLINIPSKHFVLQREGETPSD